MARGGQNKKPRRLHALQGTGRASRQGKGHPQPTPGRPTCPAWLTSEARKEWKRVAPELRRLGLLTTLDRAALAAYCQAYSRWLQANSVLAREGLVVVGHRKALRKHPLVTVLRAAEATMRAFAVELGLTPLSRERMGGTEPPTPPDALDEFLRGGGGGH